jgi:hypothetical protein
MTMGVIIRWHLPGRSDQTLVRAIDSDVVDLINRARTRLGRNHTGGGVARWESGVTGSPWLPGLFRVDFRSDRSQY